MFVLRPQNANIWCRVRGWLPAEVSACALRTRRISMRFIQRPWSVSGTLHKAPRRIQQLFQSVLPAQLEVIDRQFSACAVRRGNFSRSAALACAVGDVARTWLRDASHKSGSPRRHRGQRVFVEMCRRLVRSMTGAGAAE